MNAVIHLLNNDSLDNQINLNHNIRLYNVEFNHFLITNIKNPNKILYKNFEQIFYRDEINQITITNVLKFLENLKYEKCLVIKSDVIRERTENLFDISDIIRHFAIINDFISF